MLLIHGGGVVSQVWEARNIKRGGDLPVVDMFLLDSKVILIFKFMFIIFLNSSPVFKFIFNMIMIFFFSL